MYLQKYTLENIRRQNKFEDKQATLDLSNGEIYRGLKNYEDKEVINYHWNKQALTNDILGSYLDDIKNDKTSIILAHKKAVVHEINEVVSAKLHKEKTLGKTWLRVNGVAYRENERFVFLRYDYSLDVRNGTTGYIERIDGKELQVKTDDGRTINFNSKEYDSFAKAYAMTIHKSQGVTVDSTHLYLDKNTTSNLALVGCSRHKEELKIYTLKEHIADFDSLVKVAERSDIKSLVNDNYEISKENIAQSRQLADDRAYTQLENSIDRSRAYMDYKQAEKELSQHKFGTAIELAKDLSHKLDVANSLYKSMKDGKDVSRYDVNQQYRDIEKTYLKADDYDKTQLKHLTSINKHLEKLDNNITKIEHKAEQKQLEVSKDKEMSRGFEIGF